MKILCMGDLHFGEKGNSDKFNQQIMTFIEWATELAQTEGCEKVVQFGDYYHTRHKIDVNSLNWGIKAAKYMGDVLGKDNVIVFKGNHDLYYLDRLDVSSVNVLEPYVTVVEEVTPLENILIVPWVTDGEMWDGVVDQATSGDYDFVFGHFEFNGFMINDGYAMEHGYSPNALSKLKRVLSGHYHSPQEKGNVTYLGTPYPITMSEANESHGVYILDTETDELEFIEYDGIKVISLGVEDFLEKIENGGFDDVENTSIRVEFPTDIEDETIIEEAREYLANMGFSDSKIKYEGKRVKEILESGDGEEVEVVENIDEMVIKSLSAAGDVAGVSTEKLEKFYKQAKEMGQE